MTRISRHRQDHDKRRVFQKPSKPGLCLLAYLRTKNEQAGVGRVCRACGILVPTASIRDQFALPIPGHGDGGECMTRQYIIESGTTLEQHE